MRRALLVLPLVLGACDDDGGPPPANEQGMEGPTQGGTSGRDRDASPSEPADASAGVGALDAGNPPLDDGGPITEAGGPPLLEAGGYLRDGAPSACGDGIYDSELEECESAGVLPASCESLGFSGGTLACTNHCLLDTRACTGVEQCTDTRDNDGDGAVDCDDSDCEAACASSCGAVTEVVAASEGVRVDGSTLGHANDLGAGCAVDATAREVVYRYVPAMDGVLEVLVESGSLLVVSARTECEDDASELGCALIGVPLEVPTTAGTPVFVAVKGRERADEGPFVLSFSEREVACGNSVREGSEQCDDGNENDLDGCTNDCELNSVDSEPNDDIESASEYVNPHYAEIAPADDIDLIRFEIDTLSSVRLRVIDIGDGACADDTIDPYLRLLDDAGELMYEDDDTGDGYCSDLALDVEIGTYFAEITYASAGPATFPYRFVLNVAPGP